MADVDSWPAAVSPLIADVVSGPLRTGTVLAAFPTCVYIGLDRHDSVIALLAHDALALPIGLRLAAPAREITWGVEPGDRVEVGMGRVSLPRADVVAARVQRVTRVTPSTRVGALSTGPLSRVGAVSTALSARVPSPDLVVTATRLAASALAGADVHGHLQGLVGAGSGLTPSGDDAVCGVMLGLRAADHTEAVDRLAAALTPLLRRTTSLSAALLRAAADGFAVPEVVRLVGGDSSALAEVLAIGHSSGADLVAGLIGVDRALHAASSTHTIHTPHPLPEGAARG